MNSDSWIPIEGTKMPNPQDYPFQFSIPAISRIWGYGIMIKRFSGMWAFTTDHAHYHTNESVSHLMKLPDVSILE